MKMISDYLREEREKKGLHLSDIEKATKIKKEYLLSIESGKLHRLPSQSYAMGFVKTYGEFLGLPQQKVIALFRRDYAEDELDVVPEYRKNQHKFRKSFLFSPKGIVTIFAILVLGGYIIFQYGSLLVGPSLAISSPKNGAVVKENIIEVTGKTDQYATVLVDDDEVFVDLDGSFKKSVYTFSGTKTITVIAKNRFGKQTKKTITVKVE